MSETNHKTTRKGWAIIWIVIAINFCLLGLLIAGIVILAVQTKSVQRDIMGGLFIGVSAFLIIFSIINIASFLTNHSEYKQSFMDFFKKKEKPNQNKEVIDSIQERLNEISVKHENQPEPVQQIQENTVEQDSTLDRMIEQFGETISEVSDDGKDQTAKIQLSEQKEELSNLSQNIINVVEQELNSIKPQLIIGSTISFKIGDDLDTTPKEYFEFNNKPKQVESQTNHSIFKINTNWEAKSTEEIEKLENEEIQVAKKEEVSSDTTTIMISLDIDEATNIIEKGKSILFFKVLPVQDVKRVIVYLTKSSKHEGGIIGEFELASKDKMSKTKAWSEYGKYSTLRRKEFDEYYKDAKAVSIMQIKNFIPYSKVKSVESYGLNRGPSGFIYLK